MVPSSGHSRNLRSTANEMYTSFISFAISSILTNTAHHQPEWQYFICNHMGLFHFFHTQMMYLKTTYLNSCVHMWVQWYMPKDSMWAKPQHCNVLNTPLSSLQAKWRAFLYTLQGGVWNPSSPAQSTPFPGTVRGSLLL